MLECVSECPTESLVESLVEEKVVTRAPKIEGRPVWAEVRLDARMAPTEAIWRVPEWRAPDEEP